MKKLIEFARAFVTPAVFIVDIAHGQASVCKGMVPGNFIADCTAIAQNQGIKTGKLYGIKKTYGISLEFSHSIPESSQQSFRNAWNMYR